MTKVIVHRLLGGLALGIALSSTVLLPTRAFAQDHRGKDHHDDRRHDDHKRDDHHDDHRHDDHRSDDRNRELDRRNQDDARRQRDVADAQRRQVDRDRDRIAHDRDRIARQRDFAHRYDDRGYRDYDTHHRQNTKNQWRNLSLLGGAAGVYGLLTGNKTVAALGLGGGLYSLYRYDQDRKSQNHDAHGRYELFRRASFDHNGHHYVRRTKRQGGHDYYYFARTR